MLTFSCIRLVHATTSSLNFSVRDCAPLLNTSDVSGFAVMPTSGTFWK